MSQLQFINYAAQSWNLKRYQPTLFLSDEQETPFAIPQVLGSMISCDPEGRQKIRLHARWTVPSFGEITLMTGCLAASEQAYNLNVELARERLARIAEKQADWQAQGFQPSENFTAQYADACQVFGAIGGQCSETVKARWADLSLSLSLPASELLALEYADWGIARRKSAHGFSDFLLGCNFQHFPFKSADYERYYKELFNFATLPFYWADFEPEQGQAKWEAMDVNLAWLKKNGLKSKGHPLFWTTTIPKWVDARNLPRLKEQIRDRILTVVGRYRGQVESWDVINEIQHYLRRRSTEYDRDEAIELTRLCSDWTRQADPDAKRVVNADDPFGEYMAWKPGSGFAPLDYFTELERCGVDYDVIGIQLYYGAGFSYCRDLFEISRYFDRYERFHKELHLTETGAPSQEGEDPLDYTHVAKRHDRHPSEPWEDAAAISQASDAGFWHRPWDQENQADWMEGFYKVLMSKPFITAISCWDFSDHYQHFWSFSGMLDTEFKPKKCYDRILNLKEETIG